MKITHKLAALATAAVMTVALTGCPSFGKDDFFGTWVADYAQGSDKGVAMTMVFDGKSENLFNGGDGLFCQSKVAYTAVNAADAETGAVTGKTPRLVNFYWGSYKLKDNSNYTAGTISLTYMAGINLNENTRTVKIGNATYDLNDLMLITFGKSGTDDEGKATGLDKANTADNPETKYKTGKDFFDAHLADMTGTNYAVENKSEGITKEQAALRGDIETFTFSLSDGSLIDGYCAINMYEWYWEDQIRFTTADEGKNWTTKGYKAPENGITTATSSGRTVKWHQPNLTKTARGTAKYKYFQNEPFAPGYDSSKTANAILHKGEVVEYTAGTTPTWSKEYFSAGMCSWDVGERAFARITSDLDINSGLDFIDGNVADKKGKYIDFVKNEMVDDAYEADDSANYDDEETTRSAYATETDAEYANSALIETVGAYVEK